MRSSDVLIIISHFLIISWEKEVIGLNCRQTRIKSFVFCSVFLLSSIKTLCSKLKFKLKKLIYIFSLVSWLHIYYKIRLQINFFSSQNFFMQSEISQKEIYGACRLFWVCQKRCLPFPLYSLWWIHTNTLLA